MLSINEVTPEIGNTIQLDNGRWIRLDGEGVPATDDGFPGCAFLAFLLNIQTSVGVNVHITGRKVRYDSVGFFVTCTVEWVGDCEPSEFSKGAKLYFERF